MKIRCEICQKPFDEHNGMRHTFTPPGAPVDVSQFGPKRARDRMQGESAARHPSASYAYTQAPFDPVLRQALIDKGVITVEDLENAQRKIAQLTHIVTEDVG